MGKGRGSEGREEEGKWKRKNSLGTHHHARYTQDSAPTPNIEHLLLVDVVELRRSGEEHPTGKVRRGHVLLQLALGLAETHERLQLRFELLELHFGTVGGGRGEELRRGEGIDEENAARVRRLGGVQKGSDGFAGWS